MALSTTNPKSITAISAILTINIPALGITGHQVQGFSADDAFSFEEVNSMEEYIGVDGQLNAGYIPQLQTMRLTIAPTSTSATLFNRWFYTQKQQKEVVWAASGTIILPSVKLAYSLVNGALKGYIPAPPVRKTIQPIPARIIWSEVTLIENL